jgi:signal transduction histidine kinase
LWGNYPWIAQQSVILLSSCVGIAAGEFVKIFLNAKSGYPRLTKVLNLFYFSYLICIILSIIGINSTQLLNITALLISSFILFIAVKLANEGNRSAKFFIIAWLVFLIGVIVYALKNMGILPYNNFTIYTMPAGSAIEAILLSFALADRINILKKENEKSQATALLALRENEKLITEQNVVLEQKVHERTIMLESTNEELNATLSNLKDTQAQLVNAEKMASLGQLTAGIAHEINNPINFVSANVKPLKMDIEDVLALVKKYEDLSPDKITTNDFEEIEKFRKEIDIDYLKKEMESLLLGIEDGAKRTAEIVSGLRNFSRLDQSDVKEVNVNDGIESTLILLKSAVPPKTKIITHLTEIPVIECLPGKLNQVFVNLFSNALYAIKQKNSEDENSLTVSTYISGENVIVEIKDTGIGMTPEVKAKIFDPFFTTKDVGEGTGLGMSIVFKIIESHGANIVVESEYCVGTKILLVLNKKINFTPAI